MIGIDYNKANVDIRAMFSFTKKNATAAMERLKKIPATGWSFGQARKQTGTEHC